MENLKIVVAGDVTIDWLKWNSKAKDPGGDGNGSPMNWELYEGTRMAARPGGAMLLARLIHAATGTAILSHRLDDLENIPPTRVLHSIVALKAFPFSTDKKDEKNLLYRVDRNCGYAGPEDGKIESLDIPEDDPNADLVVLDDAGNGFRNAPKAWPKAITTKGKAPWIILKMSRPLAQGQLWDTLKKDHTEKLITVISADDLRFQGVNISRRLSWERTAKDFIWQIAGNRSLRPLSECRNLIVRFGMDGVVQYQKPEEGPIAHLFYDPKGVEGSFKNRHPGEMVGVTSAFLTGLITFMAEANRLGIPTGESFEGIPTAILSARGLIEKGFGRDANQLDYPPPEIFHSPQHSQSDIKHIRIPNPERLEAADPAFWTILSEVTQKQLEKVVYHTAKCGSDPTLDQAPVGQFKKLKTVDRMEIESLRCIHNLMTEYLSKDHPERPLSIAVFGPPGSGKSFSVTQVARSIDPERIQDLAFNLSQWESPTDLIRAFHQVRDIVLGGRVPLVFFDEFDSQFQYQSLGWLKYFLDPMQSGKFKDGETIHPIGPAIFVFAGGTSWSLREFSRVDLGAEIQEEFKAVKGPDFISRLRGFVDILGINPLNERDRLHLIRRAMLLYVFLKNKAKQLFDGSGRLQIDPGVLRALIKIPRYEHGVRSLEAILDMSLLAGRMIFEQSALPPKEQLSLHVDADLFSRLIISDVLLGAAREKLAQAIHADFVTGQTGRKSRKAASMQPWEKLEEFYRESNRLQADQIPEKLQEIHCGFEPVSDRPPVLLEFTRDEVESLAEMEHERWMGEMIAKGWKYAKGRQNKIRKTHPSLLPWPELPEKEKEKDRRTVRLIPKLLSEACFEIYRMN